MFLTMLGGSLALGAGLLAAASYSEGALLALRTAAQIIGWLFLFSTVVGLEVLRRGHRGGIAAAALTLACGLGMLYVSYFQWEGVHDLTVRHAVAEPPAISELDYKRIDPAALAPTATLASMAAPAPVQPVPVQPVPVQPARAQPAPAQPVQPVLAQPVQPALVQPVQQTRAADACASLAALESLQCRRCGGKSGLAWIACQESARLEYCEGRAVDEATCPSPIPYSHPG